MEPTQHSLHYYLRQVTGKFKEWEIDPQLLVRGNPDNVGRDSSKELGHNCKSEGLVVQNRIVSDSL